MADQPDNSQAAQPAERDTRLEQYMAASTKYRPVPVPTGFEKPAVVEFVNEHVTSDQSVRRMRKLARLAELYNARESAGAFLDILKMTERGDVDYARSAIAIRAAGWLGDDKQWAAAQTYYRGMLRRVRNEGLRDVLAEAAFFLGPKEGVGELRKWTEQRRDALKADAAKAPASQRDPLELGYDDLDEFVRLQVPKLEQAMQARERVAAVKDPASRAARLVALYLREPEEATPLLAYWAAIALVRMADQEPDTSDPIIAECLKAAQRYAKSDPARQQEFDLGRAAALRAAVFFGHELGKEDREWLDAQGDAGADVLALRPNWDYGVEAE